MTKQHRINTFLRDLAIFVEKYYSATIDEIEVQSIDDWIKVIISGSENSSLEIWTSGAEVTILFGESHWHIDEYSDPCDLNMIYSNTIHSLLEILDGELETYSCWAGTTCKGGGSFDSTTEVAIESAKGFFKDFDTIKIKQWGYPIKQESVATP